MDKLCKCVVFVAVVLLLACQPIETPSPEAIIQMTPEAGIAPLDVNLDASLSTGHLAAYSWLLTGNEKQLAYGGISSVALLEAGNYTVQLTVTDTEGRNAVSHRKIVASPPDPKAAFTSTINPAAPLTLQLDASASFFPGDAQILSYAWQATDIESNVVQSISERIPQTEMNFLKTGTYQISLVVTDTLGISAAVEQAVILRTSQPVVAEMLISPLQGTAPLELTLNANNSSAGGEIDKITSFRWEAKKHPSSEADPAIQTKGGRVASMVLTAAGSYDIILVVTDDQGTSATTKQIVEVAGSESLVADFTSVLLVDDPTQEDIFAPVIVSVDASRAFIRGEGIISGYQWHVRDASGVLLNESSGRMNEILIASAGDVSLSLTITSDTEETATRTTNIRIQDSENLVANFNLTPNVSEPGLITLDANDSRSDDLEARPLNYSWTIADDKNTLLELSFAPAQISPPLLDVGVYTITLTVQDYRGVKDILVRSYTVPEAEAEN